MLHRIRNRDFRGWVHPGLNCDLSRPFSSEFHQKINASGESVLHCRGRDIYRVPLEFEGREVNCFLYFFRNTSLSRAFRQSPARSIMKISEKIRGSGFPSIEVLAAIRPTGELLNWNSLLIVREIPNVRELPARGNHVYRVHEEVEFSRAVADRTAEELARFHDAGFYHGDLKSRHILVSGPQDSPSRITFVDLEKAAFIRFLPFFYRDLLAARDLVQMLSSLPEPEQDAPLENRKTEFLSTYLSRRKAGEFRLSITRKAVGLYLDKGSLRQGETVLQAIIRGLKQRFAGKE